MNYKEFPGLTFTGYLSHQDVNGGAALPVYETKESEDRPSINHLEGQKNLKHSKPWNAAQREEHAKFEHKLHQLNPENRALICRLIGFLVGVPGFSAALMALPLVPGSDCPSVEDVKALMDQWEREEAADVTITAQNDDT